MTLFFESFDNPRVEVDDFVDAGDQVLATVTNHGRGKLSGMDVARTTWNVWTIRDGKVIRGQAFESRAEALEAAGLTE